MGTIVIKVKDDNATATLSRLRREFKDTDVSIGRATKANGLFSSSVAKMVGMVGGIYTLSSALQSVARSGFEYNSAIEQSLSGLTALSVAIQDKSIPVMERYANANIEATKTLKDLQKINVQTPHTLDQTNKIYKSMYVSMNNAGASTSDMVEMTRSLSIASGAAGIEFNSLLAGVDGLATGTVLANSDLGRFLSSLGLTNKELKESKDVVGLVTEKLKDFKAADTMAVAVSNLENSWNMLTGEITKSSFESTKGDLDAMAGYLEEMAHWMHEYNIQANEMSDVKKSSGLETLKEQYSIAVTEMENLKSQEKDLAGMLRDRIGTMSILESYFDSSGSHNAKVIKQKGIILKLERHINSITGENAEAGNVTPFSSSRTKTESEIKALEKQIKLNEKLREASEKRGNQEWYDTELESITAIHDLEMLMEQNKADAIIEALELVKTEEDAVNEKFLETFNLMNGIFNETQLETFFNKWNSELKKVNKEQKKYDGIGSKDWTAGLKGQYKAIANIGNAFEDVATEQKKWNKFNTENVATEEDKNQHLSDQIGLYGNVSAAIGSMASEGSAAAQIAMVAQTALAVAQGVSAVLNQGSGDPYTAFARMAAMGAMVAQTLSVLGGSGGGSGGGTPASLGTAPRDSDYYSNLSEQAEDTNQPILDKFDRQIELLEEISGYGGLAVETSLERSLAEYTAQTQQDIISGSEEGSTRYSFRRADDYNASANIRRWEGEIARKVDAMISEEFRDYIGTSVQYTYTAGSAIDTYKDTFVKSELFDDSSEFVVFMEYLKNNSLLEAFGFTQLEYENILSDFQNTTNDFVVSLLEDINSLSDFSSDLKETFDEITGTTKYEDLAISKAYEEVNALLGDTDLTDYIETQILAIDALEDSLSKADIALLLSSNVDDFQEQQELISQIQRESLATLDSGVLDALNYKDSILLVSEAMVDSTSLITDILDTWIGSLESASDRIVDTANSLRSSASSATLSDYYTSMSATKSYLSNGDYENFDTSLSETISLTSALKDSNNFATQNDMDFAQLVSANQFDNLDIQVNQELTTLNEIAKSTSGTYQAQLDQNDLIEQQANEIKEMRKEIQDQSDYLASIEEKIA